MTDLEQQAALDMLTDRSIVELLCERGWQVSTVGDETGTRKRFLLWSPWQEAACFASRANRQSAKRSLRTVEES
jgi:hypothetical protein